MADNRYKETILALSEREKALDGTLGRERARTRELEEENKSVLNLSICILYSRNINTAN